jgi:penicillin amidase
MKTLRRILVFLSLLIVLAIGGIYAYLWSGAPKYSGEITLKGLKENVEVYFDDYGIPHIYATNEEDVYFALGYVHAQDRLFQMEMIRRVGSGRLSEILGKSMLETDKFFRTIGIAENAKASAKKYMNARTEPYQKAAWAYIEGLNRFIEQGATPIEFTLIGIPKQKFTPEDLYCVAGFMAFTFADAFRTAPLMSKIQQKLGADYLKDLALQTPVNTQTIPVYQSKSDSTVSTEDKIASSFRALMDKLPIPVWMGSNSWVIAPQKTKSGKVIFANDAHIGYSQPSTWYEAHLEAPNFSFYGNHLAGIPFGVIGHTRDKAWGMTMFENDDIDFFRERANPANANQVWAKDKWVDLQIREEIIQVKGQKEVRLQVKTSPHGAIINEVVKGTKGESAPIAMWWTLSQQENQTLQATYLFQHGKGGIADARRAAAMIHAPGLNIMYGDAKGNIAWWASAKLVKYPPHVNTKMILDGASGKDDNMGFYDFSENPQAENPASGFVYSANNQPDSIAGIRYPGYYLPEHRAKRIVNLLTQDKKWDVASTQEMITDVVSANYPTIVKDILQVIEKEAMNSKAPNDRKAIEILKAWNGDHQVKDIAPVIFYKLAYTILKNTFRDELGEEDFRVLMDAQIIKSSYPALFKNPASPWWDDRNTAQSKETQKMIFMQSFREAITDLEKQLGSDIQSWHWEKVHILNHEHLIGKQGGILGWLFNVGPFGVLGGSEVINNLNFHPTEKGIYHIDSGPSKRIVIDFADIENAYRAIRQSDESALQRPSPNVQCRQIPQNDDE